MADDGVGSMACSTDARFGVSSSDRSSHTDDMWAVFAMDSASSATRTDTCIRESNAGAGGIGPVVAVHPGTHDTTCIGSDNRIEPVLAHASDYDDYVHFHGPLTADDTDEKELRDLYDGPDPLRMKEDQRLGMHMPPGSITHEAGSRMVVVDPFDDDKLIDLGSLSPPHPHPEPTRGREETGRGDDDDDKEEEYDDNPFFPDPRRAWEQFSDDGEREGEGEEKEEEKEGDECKSIDLTPELDEPIVFVKSRHGVRSIDHTLPLHKDVYCGWHYHSSHNENANTSWWNATYKKTIFASPPVNLDHLIPTASAYQITGWLKGRDDAVELMHRARVRDAFARRTYNVIACRSVGQVKDRYPSMEYMKFPDDSYLAGYSMHDLRSGKPPDLCHFFVVHFPFYLDDIVESLPYLPPVLCSVVHDYQNIDTLTCYNGLLQSPNQKVQLSGQCYRCGHATTQYFTTPNVWCCAFCPSPKLVSASSTTTHMRSLDTALETKRNEVEFSDGVVFAPTSATPRTVTTQSSGAVARYGLGRKPYTSSGVNGWPSPEDVYRFLVSMQRPIPVTTTTIPTAATPVPPVAVSTGRGTSPVLK